MISVVCPVYNEAKYIEKVLEFFVRSSPAQKELLVIDGGSTDSTCRIVEQWAARYPEIRLLHNPKKYVPFALNSAIEVCKGDVIVRLDAHTEYADDYFTAVLSAFEKSGAEIVGGPMRAAGKTSFQRAVAYCTSTVFGIGDSGFHDESKEGFAESVYLGAWKPVVFKVAGTFDEQMMRNQDDEFHYRAASKGLKIYLDPRIRSIYYPRNTLRGLFKQYFQYGLYKPLVLRKVHSGMRIRHLIPSFFVLYVLSLPVSYRLIGSGSVSPLLAYVLLAIFFSCRGKAPLPERLRRLLVYPTLHLAYGSGFLLGLGKKNKHRKA